MTSSSPNPPQTQSKVVPSEVGWQFVPQYYTFVNKQPNRLHCFYTKNSTFIHGTEGEDGKPCYGQQEIHAKILSIGFQDCKVFIHSVDAQSSANGGIIIQVIGEMSNHGEPWRKFAQTFFLAEQPNGYFVLNDIFRFLKEETMGDEEGSVDDSQPIEETHSGINGFGSLGTSTLQEQPAAPPPVVEEHHVEPVAAPAPAPPSPAPVHEIPQVAARPSTPPPVEEQQAPPSALALTNGIHTTTVQADTTSPAPSEAPAPVPEPIVRLPSPPVVATPPRIATPAPATSTPTTPAKPAPPKTWANLAAANSTKWGAQVAQEAKGVSAAPPPSPQSVNISLKGNGHAHGKEPSVGKENGQHPAAAAALAISTAQCFVKSVTENVTQNALRDTLTNRFGPIKELEIVRSKACAFLEFVNIDSAKRAILASLPISQGGEGGIRVDGTEGNSGRVTVEMRKERGERPPPRPRSTGEGRGSIGGGPGSERGGANGFRGGANRGRGPSGSGRGGTGGPAPK